MLFNEQYKTLKTFTLWPQKTKETNLQYMFVQITQLKHRKQGKNDYFACCICNGKPIAMDCRMRIKNWWLTTRCRFSIFNSMKMNDDECINITKQCTHYDICALCTHPIVYDPFKPHSKHFREIKFRATTKITKRNENKVKLKTKAKIYCIFTSGIPMQWLRIQILDEARLSERSKNRKELCLSFMNPFIDQQQKEQHQARKTNNNNNDNNHCVVICFSFDHSVDKTNKQAKICEEKCIFHFPFELWWLVWIHNDRNNVFKSIVRSQVVTYYFYCRSDEQNPIRFEPPPFIYTYS